MSGPRSSKAGSASAFMLFGSSVLEFGLSTVAQCHPGKHAKKPVCEAKTRALKSDFCHTTDIAKAVALRVRAFLEQFNLDSNAARYRTEDLCCEQRVICRGCSPQSPPDLALLPIITSDQSDGRGIARLNLLEFALWKVNHYKTMRAICEIKDRLTFRHR